MPYIPRTSIEATAGVPAGTPHVTQTTVNYNDAGLNDPGITIYTPAVGDILIGFWLDIKTAWDGTTPKGDFGTFTGTSGLFALYGSVTITMTQVDGAVTGHTTLTNPGGAGDFFKNHYTRGGFIFNSAANTLKFIVSQTGNQGGAAPGATQGQAVIYVTTWRP